jgi:hypothetical protein
MCGVYAVTLFFEYRSRRFQRCRGPTQVARNDRYLGLGDDAPRARHGIFWTEGTRSTSQQSLCTYEIAELRHRDASQRERRRIVAKRDSL